MDRKVHPRRVTVMFIWIAINGKIEEISAYAAIVEQCVSFARRTVSANSCSLSLAFDQNGQQLALGAANFVGEGCISVEALMSGETLVRQQSLN